ncbi:MAG: SulP family inorganic anion transporter [Burkholderiaceae bacterium]|nr:SulP family inorganic anion transporter [Burkholderiaceae bacterium]
MSERHRVNLLRLFPFLAWRRPTRETLWLDLMAGISVALLAIPQSLAYAQLAGVPAYYGLYAAFVPSIVGVLFGSSAILSTGPVAMTSLLTAASVATVLPAGSSAFAAYVTLLALLSGLFQVAMGLARAGALLNLLSHPVLVGFINAAACVIALSQLPALTGIDIRRSDNFLLDVVTLLGRLTATHGLTALFGVVALVLLWTMRRFTPRIPGVLVMAAILTLASWWIGFGESGGAVVGKIPTGLPAFSVPWISLDASLQLLPAAFVIALVSFMEAMSSCKVIAIRTRTRWDENQELVGQGLAKVAAAFVNSMPVSGSFSRSALNLASNARTGVSSLFSAGFVVLTLLFLTPLLYHLPKPALAAMIVMAVANLLDVGAMRSAWRANRDDGMAAWLTFGATLAFAPNIQNGILIGMIFSLGAFIFRNMVPPVITEVRSFADPASGQAETARRVVALRFDAGLFFANSAVFEKAMMTLEREHPDLEHVLVIANGINHADASAVEMLRNLSRHLGECGIGLAFSGVRPRVKALLERTGLVAEIGEDNFFTDSASAYEALNARLQEAGQVPQVPATPSS